MRSPGMMILTVASSQVKFLRRGSMSVVAVLNSLHLRKALVTHRFRTIASLGVFQNLSVG
jgi:hypothetical protein